MILCFILSLDMKSIIMNKTSLSLFTYCLSTCVHMSKVRAIIIMHFCPQLVELILSQMFEIKQNQIPLSALVGDSML